MTKKLIFTDPIFGFSPFDFGRHDASIEDDFEPENLYMSADCIVHYTLGYISIAGESEATAAILAKYDSPEIAKEWITCDWEFRWNDKPDRTWHPCFEEYIFTQIRPTVESMQAVKEEMEKLRKGEVAIFRNLMVDIRWSGDAYA